MVIFWNKGALHQPKQFLTGLGYLVHTNSLNQIGGHIMILLEAFEHLQVTLSSDEHIQTSLETTEHIETTLKVGQEV